MKHLGNEGLRLKGLLIIVAACSYGGQTGREEMRHITETPTWRAISHGIITFKPNLAAFFAFNITPVLITNEQQSMKVRSIVYIDNETK